MRLDKKYSIIRNIRILTLDLETSPLIAYSWGGKWETNLIEVIEQSRILSYSAKWLGGKHITKGWPDYKGYRPGVLNDKQITKDLWNLVDAADVIITQNGKNFDVRVLNARFVKNGLTPPSPYRVVDTKTEAKRYLRLPSNSLDDICDYFSIGRKQEHEGFPLWKKCIAGDAGAWKRMLRYNKHDVVLTEKLYELILPWMNHPNRGMYTDKLVCPRCGSTKLQSRGWQVNQTTKYKRINCQGCGGWGKLNKRGTMVTNA